MALGACVGVGVTTGFCRGGGVTTGVGVMVGVGVTVTEAGDVVAGKLRGVGALEDEEPHPASAKLSVAPTATAPATRESLLLATPSDT